MFINIFCDSFSNKSSIDSINTSITDINSKISTNTNSINSINTNISSLSNRVTTLESSSSNKNDNPQYVFYPGEITTLHLTGDNTGDYEFKCICTINNMQILICTTNMGNDTYANAIKKKWYTTINGRQYMLRIPAVFDYFDYSNTRYSNYYTSYTSLNFKYWA